MPEARSVERSDDWPHGRPEARTVDRSIEDAFWNPDPDLLPFPHDLDGHGGHTDAARLVRAYVHGDRVDVDTTEREHLADWAERQACPDCRDELGRSHDPARLRHDDCRTALRAGRVLRRG